MENRINVWAMSLKTRALGPGLRYAIWTQGCLQRCKGCTSPESRTLEPRLMLSPSDLAFDIISRREIEGITISGGEPFLQAGPLSEMLSIVRASRPDIDVIVFSGYPVEVLTWEDARRLLENTDVLIDGPFEMDKRTDKGLRGSANQRIHFLTDRLIKHERELESGPRILETFIKGNELITIGIPINNNQ